VAGRRSGVVVDSSRCGKDVHGGAVLRAVTGSSKGLGWRYAVAQQQRQKSVAQRGRWVKEEERRLHGGGWAPFIAARGGG
jgi:hypothetical protein